MQVGRTGMYLGWLFLIASCNAVPFKEAPPYDRPPLNAFPDTLHGFYYLSSTKDMNGKPIPPDEVKCAQTLCYFEIYRDSMVIHDYRTDKFRIKPRDTAIVEVNDSLITVNRLGTRQTCPYIICEKDYIAITRDHKFTLALSDSVKLKNEGQYYFLSMGIQGVWAAIVFRQKAAGEVAWLTTFKHKDKKKLEAMISAITPPVPTTFEGKPAECYNPDTKALLQMIHQGIYQVAVEFKRNR